MSNYKQSSVDFLINLLTEKGYAGVLSEDEVEQAKAMHEAEIVNTIVDCEKEHIIQAECYPPQFVLTKAEHYYNITFGG